MDSIGPVLQGLLNLSGLAGSKVDMDKTIPQALKNRTNTIHVVVLFS